MLKRVLFTEREVEELKDVITSKGELIEKEIVEDEMEGADLVDAKNEIDCLDGIYKKLTRK